MNAKTLLSAAASGALMAMAASSAQALPTFYFNAYGGWLDGTATGFPDPAFTGIEASGSPAAGDAPQFLPAGINNNLIWGTATGNGGPFSGRSGAIINDPASLTSGIGHMQQASIEAGDLAPVLLGTLTHINEPIDNVFEGDVRVRYFFDVYADAARTQFIASLDSAPFGDFLIHFNETLNAEPCQAGSVSVCDDVFSFGPANATDSFIFEGKEYKVTLSGFYDSETLQNLTGEFFSPEGGSSVGFVGVVTVPEPATLALMGLGLLGIGVSAHRRRHPETV